MPGEFSSQILLDLMPLGVNVRHGLHKFTNARRQGFAGLRCALVNIYSRCAAINPIKASSRPSHFRIGASNPSHTIRCMRLQKHLRESLVVNQTDAGQVSQAGEGSGWCLASSFCKTGLI